jgi:heme exporter protein B
MMAPFRNAVQHGLLCALRRPVDVAVPLAFFLLVAIMFPLAIGPDRALLLRIAPGVLWVGALLASLLALHRLFEPGLASGMLEQMLLSPHPAVLHVAGRIAAHWLTGGVPMALFAPLLALQYGLDGGALGVLCGGLLLGTTVFCLLGAVGAALTLGGRGGSVLTALILLPLYVPVLILGTGALSATLSGSDGTPHLLLLGALACAALALAPWATTTALRLALE